MPEMHLRKSAAIDQSGFICSSCGHLQKTKNK